MGVPPNLRGVDKESLSYKNMLQSRFALFPIRHNLLQQFVKRFPVMAMHRMAQFVGQYILDACGRRFYQFRIYPDATSTCPTTPSFRHPPDLHFWGGTQPPPQPHHAFRQTPGKSVFGTNQIPRFHQFPHSHSVALVRGMHPYESPSQFHFAPFGFDDLQSILPP